MQDKFINLIKSSLNENKFYDLLTIEDYKVLRANQLSGSVYPSIKHQENLLAQFKEDYYQYIKRDEEQNQMIEEIRKLFNNKSIDFVFLKGSFLKSLYPKPYMRTMGDIDILIRPELMEKVHQVLNNHGFKLWNESENHDCFLKHRINIEVHPNLDADFSKEYKDLFVKPWNFIEPYNKHEFHLKIEYNFFYQLYHMIKHIYHSGVGFRTIIDLALTMKEMKRRTKLFDEIYEQFPKKEFVNFIISLVAQIFQINMFNYEKINDEIMDKYLNFMFASGMHGTGEEYNMFIGGMAEEHQKDKWVLWTKTKFLLMRVFPNYKQMSGMYRYLKKCPLLLPFAYIQRMFKLIFKKTSRRKLKRLKASKKDIEDIEELFIQIGLKQT